MRQGVKRGKKERRKSENSKMNEEREGEMNGVLGMSIATTYVRERYTIVIK